MTDETSPNPLSKLMRRTTISAVAISALGFVVALLLGSALGALGVVLGFGVALLNFRLLDREVSRVNIDPEAGEKATKAARNQLGRSAGARLGIVTVVVIATFMLSKELALGTAIGVALSQVSFAVNAYGAVASERGLKL
jgi:hypothetical protein